MSVLILMTSLFATYFLLPPVQHSNAVPRKLISMGGSFDSCSLPIQTEMIILLANGYLKLDELLNYLKMKYPVLSLMTYTFQCTPTQSSEIACVFFSA